MTAIASNNSGLFSLLGEELTRTTFRTNRAELAFLGSSDCVILLFYF